MIDRLWPCGSEFIGALFDMVRSRVDKCAILDHDWSFGPRADFNAVRFATIVSQVVLSLAGK